jgi:hypothetical protein
MTTIAELSKHFGWDERKVESEPKPEPKEVKVEKPKAKKK